MDRLSDKVSKRATDLAPDRFEVGYDWPQTLDHEMGTKRNI